MKRVLPFIPSTKNASGVITTNGINKGEQLVIYNDSKFSIELDFADSNSDIIPPAWAKDWILENVPMGNVQWKILDQLTVTNYPLSKVYGSLYEKGEHTARVNHSMARTNAVTPTATGDPIFTASVGFGATGFIKQILNIFNPANSDITYVFHSARCYTNDATGPTVNLAVISGADLNLTNAVPIICHDGSAAPRVSSAHATSVDQAGGVIGSNPIIEVLNMTANVFQDMILFPDQVSLAPGNNLLMELSSGSSAHIVRLTMKFTEQSTTPPTFVAVGGGTLQALATSLINDALVTGSTIIEARVLGSGSSGILVTNDGQLTLAGLLHALSDIQTDGHFLEPNNVAYRAKDSTNTSRDILALDAANNLILHTGGAAAQFNVKQLGGAELIIIDNSGQTFTHGLIVTSAGDDFVFQSPAGTEVGRIQNNQVLDMSRGSGLGQVKFKVGTITRISFFTATLGITFSNVAHGLGVLPDIVLGINNGTSVTVSSCKWNPAASDATNASMVSSNAGITFQCVAIKF